MTPLNMAFGVLTMATPNDYRKAIGLALSVRCSNPGVPIAVACHPKLRPLLQPYFDVVVDEDPSLRGFVHKVHMDRYTPFTETVFFDSDVLVFKPVWPAIAAWRQYPYSACGILVPRADCVDGLAGRCSTFGMDRIAMLDRLSKPAMTVIDGAGHAYFRKPDCGPLFEMAREVTARHREIMGPIPYADEDVMDYVMTAHDIPPQSRVDDGGFFSRHMTARPGTLSMDSRRAHCRFVSFDTGQPYEPVMMHFAANEAAFRYHVELWRLFRQFGVPMQGLLQQCLHDAFVRYVRDPAASWRRRIPTWLGGKAG